MTKRIGRAFDLGPMPYGSSMQTVDEQTVRAPLATIFELASQVELWPKYLPHYRYVRFRTRRSDGGGLVEMSANRPFEVKGPRGRLRINWPTWWLSEMAVDRNRPSIRYRHVGGITREMDVEWSFSPTPEGTHVRIVHLWEGPRRLRRIGRLAATHLIGPVFVHGIASRTLAGLAAVAERESKKQPQ
ncbi:MAG TPA: SRPBCC family protein [Gemmatimonadaceae bacterium]|jgi:ribosome-associated toxin RatA of RatAB toxin-antitoxin module|nr:SRPBCC family protein [Gemmatimonadaceae bacterium]